MKQLHDLYRNVLENGTYSEDRTGTGTIKLIGQSMRFNLQEGFPATTTKRLAWKAMLSELLWFLEGSSDERRLCEILHNSRDPELTTIWTDNYLNQGVKLGYTDGQLGPVYGKQWRFWDDYVVVEKDDTAMYEYATNNGYEDICEDTYRVVNVYKKTIDQIERLIDGITNDPYGRRHILSAWNVGDIDKMALPPCHSFSQFFVVDGKLSCTLYQRSADLFLGVPFNIASYSLLTHMLAQVCGLDVGEFIWMGGGCHIYSNHVDQVNEQLSRTPKELPTLIMDKTITDIDSFTMTSCSLDNYKPDATIKAPMAV